MYKCIAFLFFGITTYGQYEVSGTISDEKETLLVGATIYIPELDINTISNDFGAFKITDLKIPAYTVEISHIGFNTQQIPVSHSNNEVLFLKINLTENTQNLNEVIVHGKTKEQKKREEPIVIKVIELSKVSERATALPQIINQTSGVKIRQRGGVGSEAVVNINGLQGKSIRFFKDGVPTDYLGRSFDVNLVPTNLISNVEIYKGVLPIDLGADALGGAINIVTKMSHQNFLNTSYEVGSFNTHIANINSNYLITNSKINLGINGYYITSENNYRFTAPVLDVETQNFKEQSVRRFHDGLESYFIQFFVGFNNTKFADFLRIEASHFNLDKEAQVGNSISRPIGEATFYESSNVISLAYKKELFSNADINFFFAYSRINNQLYDVSNNKYDWLGNVISTTGTTTGELQERKSDSDINKDAYVARINGSNTINPNLKIKFSSTLNSKRQVGTDPYQEKNFISGIQPITIPSTYSKLISGIGISNSFFKKKVLNIFSFKHFYLNTTSVSAFVLNTEETQVISNWGWGNSLKYEFGDTFFARISYEETTRIPDAEEYFGDNLFNLSNPSLVPEKSKNLNFGFYASLNTSKTLFLDTNLFYRNSEQFIRRVPFGFIFTRHENTDGQIAKGIETNLKLNLPNILNANLAITYQDLRRVNTKGSALENSRTPNVPYFFTNINAVKTFKEPFGFKVRTEIYASYSYTEQYLLTGVSKNLEPALFERDIAYTDLIIPTQHLVDIGITLKFNDLPIHINGEITNIGNNRIYDEFRIQKPLRAFKLKMTYKL